MSGENAPGADRETPEAAQDSAAQDGGGSSVADTSGTKGAGNARGTGPRSASSPPVDFTTLILSLHEAALQSMGAKDADIEVDLDSAHYEIDLLAMLQAKTSGNLSDDEDRLLRTILYELRTAYVRMREARARG